MLISLCVLPNTCIFAETRYILNKTDKHQTSNTSVGIKFLWQTNITEFETFSFSCIKRNSKYFLSFHIILCCYRNKTENI